MTMLSVTDLHAGYGRVPVLNGVSLDVAEGEVLGILGHNGMGKTTLLRTLMGLIAPTSGRIALAGRDVTRSPPHRRSRLGMGYVAQGRRIFPGLSVRDNLRMGVAAHGDDEAAAVAGALTLFPALAPLLGRRGDTLSGGEQQMLAVARCLCAAPRLMLLDEPTEGVQPSIVDTLADRLAALRRERGLAMVLVEQNLDFIAALSDRVLLIQKGRIVRAVTPEDLSTLDLIGEFGGFGD